MEPCGRISKYLLVIFNLIIFIVGIASVAVGIWILLERNDFEELVGSEMYTTAAYLLIVGGGIVVILSFFGCMGALKEVKCMLVTFFLFLFLLFILLMAGAILGYVFRSEVEGSLKKAMNETIYLHYGISVKDVDGASANVQNQAITDAWDYVQREFKCCGAGNFTIPKDHVLYSRSLWCNRRGEPENKPVPPVDLCVPNSCCGEQDIDTGGPGCNEDNVYKNKGCYQSGYEFLLEHALYIGGLGIAIAVILIVGMLLVIFLYRAIE